MRLSTCPSRGVTAVAWSGGFAIPRPWPSISCASLFCLMPELEREREQGKEVTSISGLNFQQQRGLFYPTLCLSPLPPGQFFKGLGRQMPASCTCEAPREETSELGGKWALALPLYHLQDPEVPVFLAHCFVNLVFEFLWLLRLLMFFFLKKRFIVLL